MSGTGESADRQAVLKQALQEIKQLRGKVETSERARREPIAVLGQGEGATGVTRRVSGGFLVLLPAPPAGTPLRLSLSDAAGNTTDVPLP